MDRGESVVLVVARCMLGQQTCPHHFSLPLLTIFNNLSLSTIHPAFVDRTRNLSRALCMELVELEVSCTFSFGKTNFTFPLYMSTFLYVAHTTVLSVAIVRMGCFYERCVFRAGSGHYTAYAVHEGKRHLLITSLNYYL